MDINPLPVEEQDFGENCELPLFTFLLPFRQHQHHQNPPPADWANIPGEDDGTTMVYFGSWFDEPQPVEEQDLSGFEGQY